MMKYLLILVLPLIISGCFRLVGIEHSVYGSVARSHSGGTTYSEYQTGHEEQGGGWTVGTKVKTIWGR